MFGSILCLFMLQIHTEAVGGFDSMKVLDKYRNMTEMEFQVYFGEVPRNEDYDMSYLTPVNERGKEITRARRDTAAKRQTFYNISILGLSLHLNLTLNEHLLAPDFHVETTHRNGSTTKLAPTHRNFYHGHVISYPGSKVTLSGQYRLRGTIEISEDRTFVIHPLSDRLSNNYENFGKRVPHLVIKRSIVADKPIPLVDDMKYLNGTFIVKRDLEQEQSDGQDGDGKSKFLEVIYVADQHAIKLYGMIDLPEMLLSIGNIVSQLIYGISYGDPKVVYVINKIRLVNDGTLSYPKKASKLDKLIKITKWAQKNNVLDDNNANHADQTVLFTTHNNGGMATQGVVCRRSDASAMVSLNGLSSAFVAAHETGHSLGYGHDGDKLNKKCPNAAGIMSTYLPSGQAAFIWSNCSRKFAQQFLKSDHSRCLDNMPKVRGPTQSPSFRAKLPGEVFDADKQCEMIFGAGKKQCSAKKTVCSSLFCTKSSSACSYVLSPPADGTRCGDRQWCIHGECVDDGSPVINGNWGEWTEYTPCTRSCGGGVQHKRRKCDKPSPSNGGRTCVGSSVGQHKICNVKACPVGAVSYRQLQCQSAGYSKAYYIKKEACSLWCLRKWKIFSHGIVNDGTPCSDDISNNDICVGGLCQPVGCDLTYHSEKEIDRCGECDGGGFYCAKHELFFTTNTRKFGIFHPLPMIVLKNGSSNIFVKKAVATWNWIGVRNMKGEYLISLPSWSPKEVFKAGTKISYIHHGRKFRDEIIIPGPILEDLQLVFVRVYEDNKGVKISYFEPVDNPETPPRSLFSWKEYKWSECSQNCGGGSRKRKVICRRKDDMSVVGNRFCNLASKPEVEELCYSPCPAEWFLTDWKPCSKRCGSGIQTRNIICRRKEMDSWTVKDDSACIKPRLVEPNLKRRCNEMMCPPEYSPQAWSECSTSCEEGVSTRKLKCQIINENGISEIVLVRVCEQNGSPEPQTTRRCNHDVPCQDKALNYILMGCFHDSKNSRLLPEMLANLRSRIDWHNPSATIDECAIFASKKGKKYFGIQYYGECRSYKDGHFVDYTKLGVSLNFWAGLGGSWTNCVYKFQ